MASEKVSAFNLYLLDVFDLVKTPTMSSEEAYNIIEEEWKGLSRDIVFYYISKERELEIKNHMNHISHISQMSYNNDNSISNRAEYVALYKRKSTSTDSIVILELRGDKSNLPDYQSTFFHFKSTRSELAQLHKYIKSTFLPRNFENRDYSLSLQLGDKISLNINRAFIFGRRYAVVGVSEQEKSGLFLITERGLDELFGFLK